MSTYGDAGLGLLGDPTRRAIFELLARRPCSVQQLADQLPISRPAVSQHLRVLRDGGLVVSRAEGTRRIYQLNPEGVTALRAWLDGVWGDALAGFHKAAEAAADQPDPRRAGRPRPRTGDLMTTTAPIPPITGTVTIGVPIDTAFEVFTGSITTWWPHEYHIGQAAVAEVVLESGVGGRWYERGVDGSECDWGRVLVWEPPHRVVFTWQISGSWQFDPDPAHASEIEARFTADGPGQTTVAVEHRYFERLVGGQAISDAINEGGGWALLLDGFAKTVADQGGGSQGGDNQAGQDRS